MDNEFYERIEKVYTILGIVSKNNGKVDGFNLGVNHKEAPSGSLDSGNVLIGNNPIGTSVLSNIL